MKTKKTVIAVLTVTLLITAALVVGCIDTIEVKPVKPDVGEDPLIQIPAGKGIVRFKISAENARTILPTGLPTADNAYYEVTFAQGATTLYYPYDTDEDAGTVAKGRLQGSAINGSPLVLDTGEWTITITAFDSDTNLVAFAGWEVEDFEIENGPNPVTADLRGFADGDVAGTFTWDIDNSSSGGSPSFTLTNMKDNSNAGCSGVSGSEDIPSGYYLANFTSTKDHYQTAQYVRVVHIYPGMISTLSGIVVPPLVENEFLVTFDLDSSNNVPLDNDEEEDFVDGIYVLYGNYLPSSIPAPEPSDSGSYYFSGWFEDDFSTEIDYRIKKAITAYAVYGASGGTVIFTVNLLTGDTEPITGGVGISEDAFFKGTAVTGLGLGAAPGTSASWTDVKYHIGGNDYSSLVIKVDCDNTGTVSGTNFNHLIIPSTSFEVNVSATVSGGEYDGIKYSGTLVVTVGS